MVFDVLGTCCLRRYSFAKAGKGIASPYPDCSKLNPPTSPAMAVPPRLPTGVPGATNRAGDGWGVNFHANEASGKTSELDMVAAAFRIVRLDMSWGSVENKAGGCGVYNFSAYDEADAAWRARSVQPLYVLDCECGCRGAEKTRCATVARAREREREGSLCHRRARERGRRLAIAAPPSPAGYRFVDCHLRAADGFARYTALGYRRLLSRRFVTRYSQPASKSHD